MQAAGVTVDSASVLSTLLLCGLMGLLGQGVRAAVGLKNAMGLTAGLPAQQSEFNAAYFFFSLMIGFIAGIVAGLAVGLTNFVKVDLSDLKVLLGVAAAGYAGADFIENSLSIVFPGSKPQAASADASADGTVRTLSAKVDNLETRTDSITSALAIRPRQTGEEAAPGVVPGLTLALKAAAPHVDVATWAPALSTAFIKFNMASHRRMAAAIGQFLVEAGAGFQEVVENLRYSHAGRIVQVFPREFHTEAEAQPYVNNPEALGNRAYANKLGNGNEASGDGYRFRGRGLIQLTGRNEYQQFGATVGMTAEQASQYLETPDGAAMSACWYLSTRGCLPFADSWNLSEITRRVNGQAVLGNAQRIAYSNAVLHSLGDVGVGIDVAMPR
jgi:predicted chitinase